MAERSQHSNILLAFISLTAVIVIVSLIGFFTLGKGPEIVSIRPRACFFPLFSFLPLWLHYNLNPLCVQY